MRYCVTYKVFPSHLIRLYVCYNWCMPCQQKECRELLPFCPCFPFFHHLLFPFIKWIEVIDEENKVVSLDDIISSLSPLFSNIFILFFVYKQACCLESSITAYNFTRSIYTNDCSCLLLCTNCIDAMMPQREKILCTLKGCKRTKGHGTGRVAFWSCNIQFAQDVW